ncbi:MAG: thiol reductase thioredoxin [Actinobacteria bacterium 13_2_20CM_2_71_6]|nr:MAG: thiol reductase thioredoxin [Actinobacteria bacterium 13_2_20CM_2_71_6]
MVLAGLGTAIGVLVLATVAGLWWRRRDGRLRTVVPAGVPDHLAYLGVVAGTPVTLLQFSSAFCAPCRTTRQVCADVAKRFDGVAHLEVDAEEHLDAVRRLDIWRTPTVLVVDATGRIVRRASGTPGRAQVIAAIAPLLPAGAAR